MQRSQRELGSVLGLNKWVRWVKAIEKIPRLEEKMGYHGWDKTVFSGLAGKAHRMNSRQMAISVGPLVWWDAWSKFLIQQYQDHRPLRHSRPSPRGFHARSSITFLPGAVALLSFDTWFPVAPGCDQGAFPGCGGCCCSKLAEATNLSYR